VVALASDIGDLPGCTNPGCIPYHAMTEEYHSIVIVGAGMTGLYASRILSKLNKDVIVVEAQDHVGGRVKQIEGHAPWPIEVGPEFIHGANSMLVDLIDELGFTYHEREWPDWWYFGPEKRLVHDSAGDEDVARVHTMFSTVMSEMPPAPLEPDVSARQWMKLRGANDKMISIADACYANDMAGSMDQLGLRELVQEDRW
jgi:monoamine oxidase